MRASHILCLGMAVVYTFFGLTLLAAPEFFWGKDSAFTYWNEWHESGVWLARALGIWMSAVTLSPYYAGVDKAALCRVYLPINIVAMALFAQALFIDTTTGKGEHALLPFSMWWTQLPVGIAFLILNLVTFCEAEVRAPEDRAPPTLMEPVVLIDIVFLGMAAVYGLLFGLTILVAPEFFWGEDSLFAYWNKWVESGIFFARALGIWMFAFTMSPYYAGIKKEKLIKVYLPINIVLLALFIQALFFYNTTAAGKHALLPFSMWWMQLPLGIAFLILNLAAFHELSKAEERARPTLMTAVGLLDEKDHR